MTNKQVGLILYSKVDIEKNKSFVTMFQENFLPYNIEIRLVIVEEINDYAKWVAGLLESTQNGEKIIFAINRSRNWLIAKALETNGIRVFNNSKVTKIANNKKENYLFLKGVVTYMDIIEDEENQTFAYPYIIKSCKGHGGSEVFMVKNDAEEKQALSCIEGDYVIQKPCSDLGKDVRVYVMGNKIVKAVLRTSKDSFKSNFSLGGKVREYILNDYEISMVEKILEKLSIDYGGIDFIFHHNKVVFNEIEDAVGARMLYQCTDIDIVKLYTQYILNEISI